MGGSALTIPSPLLVLVSGAPGTGKTTLAQYLSQTLALPLLSRDMIRHIVLDAFNVQSWDEGKSYSIAIYDIFYGIIAQLLKANLSVIADCNFYRGVSESFIRPLISDTTAHAILVHLTTTPEISMRRFIERAQQPDRRHSSFDADRIAQIQSGEFKASPAQYEPLDLDVPTLVVDTTVNYEPDINIIVEFIRSALQKSTNHH
jgi:predicted kinase